MIWCWGGAHLRKSVITVWSSLALLCEMHIGSQCGGKRGHCFPEDRLAARAINYKRQGDRQLAS